MTSRQAEAEGGAHRTAGSNRWDMMVSAHRVKIGAAALIVVTLVAYLPAIRGGYVFDDDTYLTRNRLIVSEGGLLDIWLKPAATPQYYPLVFTTFWIEARLGRLWGHESQDGRWVLDPTGFHLVNVLLHGIAAVLLWRVLWTLSVPGAWLAAAIFALHPVHAESVAWIVERKNVLSGVFYLAALSRYVRFARLGTSIEIGDERSGASWRRWRHYVLALVYFILALLSKSVICTLPAAILLVLWWQRARLGWRDVVPLIPLFAVGMASGLVTAWLETHQVGARGAEFAWSFADRWLIAGRGLWFYASKLIWPVNLSFVYPRWEIDAGSPWQYLFPVSAAAVPVALWLGRRRIGKGPLVAVLFFMGTLAPALGFFKIYAMRYSFAADHWQYHASIGLIALFAAIAAYGAVRLQRLPPGRAARKKRPRRRWYAAVAVPSVALLAALGILTWRQAGAYKDLETFWRAALNSNPGAWMAHNNLGMLLMRRKRVDEAIHHFSEALSLRPAHFVAQTNRGVAFFMKGRVEDAVAEYRAALETNPRYPLAHNHLAVALMVQEKVDEAIDHYRRALEVRPGYVAAHKHLAMALEQQGDLPEAVEHYRAAIEHGSREAAVYNKLARLLATCVDDRLRDGPQALRWARWACRARGEPDASFLATLAAAYAEVGQFDQALSEAGRARALAAQAGRSDLKDELDKHMELYKADRPLREPREAEHANSQEEASRRQPRNDGHARP